MEIGILQEALEVPQPFGSTLCSQGILSGRLRRGAGARDAVE